MTRQEPQANPANRSCVLTNRSVYLNTSLPMMKHSLNVGLTTLLIFSSGMVATLAAFADSTSPMRTVQQIPVNSRVVYVNPILGADTPTSGRENFPYRTIAYALQQATDNTVIQLAPGSYTRDTGEVFPLTIPPGVIVRGDEPNNGETSVIIGSGSLVSPTFAGQNVTIVMLDDSQLRGVTVTNPNSRGTGVWVESTNPTIRNNTFSNSLREGVFVTGTGTPTVESNVFIQNDANGISVVRQSSGKIRNNEFQNTGFAIAVGDTSTPLIEGNQIVENVDGVVASNRARPILRRNVIRNNSRDGVVAIAEAMPDLGTADDPGENIIVNNGRYAINNSTRNNVLLAVGNQVDAEQIAGDVEFVARVVGFPDVQGHWAQAYIEALASRGIIGGFPDGTFRPNDPVTRAQFAAIVTKAFEAEPKRPLINFVDVSQSFWAYRAIREAYRSEFMSGYPGQVFRPDEQIPRVQVLVSLASGLGLDEGNASALNKYSDSSLIPEWAKTSVAAATERSIVVNYPDVNQLSPNEVATRADVGAFVYQALVSTGDAEAISSPYAVTYP